MLFYIPLEVEKMFLSRWLWISEIIFMLILTLSIYLSVRKFFFLSPSVRLLKITAWKFWTHLFWGIVIFLIISFVLGAIISGAWEGFSYFFAEAVYGPLLCLVNISASRLNLKNTLLAFGQYFSAPHRCSASHPLRSEFLFPENVRSPAWFPL